MSKYVEVLFLFEFGKNLFSLILCRKNDNHAITFEKEAVEMNEMCFSGPQYRDVMESLPQGCS